MSANRLNEEMLLGEGVRLLCGVYVPECLPVDVFDEHVMDFLEAFSKALRKDRRSSVYTDVAALSFWCRRGNLLRLKDSCQVTKDRIGRGIIFHIAPSNVPVNFAYSYVLGLLSGNANIVRVSGKDFEQTRIITDVLSRVFETGEYDDIKNGTSIVSYGHSKEVNDAYSAICDGRVIWGGDATINEIRKSPVGSRSVEVAFADRHSMGMIRPSAVCRMNDEEIKQLGINFFNDTYLMDQNACTAPHVIAWITDCEEETQACLPAKQKFWNAVIEAAQKYDLEDIKVSDKFDRLCNALADAKKDQIKGVRKEENLLYVVDLSYLDGPIDTLRGSFGMFFETELSTIDEIAPHVTKKVQTIAVLGVDRQEIISVIRKYHLIGIDRICGFGETLNMGILWDGYDIIGTLSRVIA